MAMHFGPIVRFEARAKHGFPAIAICTTWDCWPSPDDAKQVADPNNPGQMVWTLSPPAGEAEWVSNPTEYPNQFQDRIRADLKQQGRADNYLFIHFPDNGFWGRTCGQSTAPWL